MQSGRLDDWGLPKVLGKCQGEAGSTILAASQSPDTQPEKWVKRVESLNHLRDSVFRNLDKAYKNQAKYYNISKRDRNFKVRDSVLRPNRKLWKKANKITEKLFPKFKGPYKIKFRLYSVVYTVVKQNGKFIAKEHLIPRNERGNTCNLFHRTDVSKKNIKSAASTVHQPSSPEIKERTKSRFKFNLFNTYLFNI